MKNLALSLATALAVVATPAIAATVGQPAPDFSAPDLSGKPVKLSDFRGKFVVLEWTNPECPIVQKHYVSKNMQGLQQEWGDQGVVWLSVNSTNANHAEFKTGAQMASWMRAQGAAQKATLLDSSSATGHAAGKVIYNGAIDDKRSANPADAKGANNYVRAALTEALAGKPVTTAATSPYGCSVKY